MTLLTIDNDKPVYTIGLISSQFKTHQRTLRIYDEEHILTPQRSTTSRRLYSNNDVLKLQMIQYMTQQLGMNISGIKIVMSMLQSKTDNLEEQFKILQNTAESSGFTNVIMAANKLKNSNKGRKAHV